MTLNLIWVVPACGVAAILFAVYLAWDVLRRDTGTEKMQDVGATIHVGAVAFIKRQYTTIAILSVVTALIITGLIALFERFPEVDISIVELGIRTGIAFLAGAACSAVSGIIGMSGDLVGSTVLSFPLATAKLVVAKFIGEEVTESSDDFGDAIGELVNMITGGAKAKFGGKSVSISCPSVVIGPNHKVQQMSDSTCISIPCQCECGAFAVEVSVKEGDSEGTAQTDAARSTASN